MSFSEFKNVVKNSKTYEFLTKLFNFFKEYKTLSYILITIIIGISIIISPIMYKIVYNNTEVESGTMETETDFTDKVVVYISGEINKPGTYTLTTEDRISDLIDIAGGITENADIENINLAQKLYDEQHLNIPSKAEHIDNVTTGKSNHSANFTGVININTATSAELQQLPGIGQIIADRIIEYRNNAGFFVDKRDIMNIEGIGTSLYDKIKNNITI